jgi:polyhydroxyalkanoate synthase
MNQQYDILNLQQTWSDIFSLVFKLAEIYKSTYLKILPSEVTQYSHGMELMSKVALKQRIEPEDYIQLQAELFKELSAVYTTYIVDLTQFKHVLHEHNADTRPKQFSHHVWHENANFKLLKNLYLLLKKFSFKWLHAIEGLDHKTKQQLHFYLSNYLDMLAPTNAIWSNPEVIESIISSGGANLIEGFKKYLDDLVLNHGQMNVRMTDMRNFKIGVNLGATPGKVIFQNDLIQLIQYEATTEKVYATPILITPPFINKYYVLDLSEHNSLAKWLVSQGFTVYMISWVNPGAEFAETTFDDYMQDGPLAALDVITKNDAAKHVHMVGYCIGGTLLACALAYLRKKNDKRPLSATFLMSLLDFSESGEIGAFLDEPQLDALDKLMKSNGYLNGQLLDITFNLLRPNDLIWPYYINNYLLGKNIKPLDILFWNADSSNLPYKMYSFYLREMCLHNKLHKPDTINLSGVPIDLGKIDIPAFFLAAESDHITLWKAIFKGIPCLSGPTELVLTESGHVRGVLNPPGETKYNFRENAAFSKNVDFKVHAKEWYDSATLNCGSWWPHWQQWLVKHDKTMIPAIKINKKDIIEDAPGSYVLKRLSSP